MLQGLKSKFAGEGDEPETKTPIHGRHHEFLRNSPQRIAQKHDIAESRKKLIEDVMLEFLRGGNGGKNSRDMRRHAGSGVMVDKISVIEKLMAGGGSSSETEGGGGGNSGSSSSSDNHSYLNILRAEFELWLERTYHPEMEL